VIPDETQSLSLHKKYGSTKRIVAHCQACAWISRMLAQRAAAKGSEVNEKAVVAGALLHDIGRTQTQLVGHGYVGAALLEGEGVDQAVTDIVRRHVGAGISKDEAARLGFPEGEYVPQTLEEKIVCFADKLLDGERRGPSRRRPRGSSGRGTTSRGSGG